MNNINTKYLILILGLIIIISPPILIRPAFSSLFDFSKTGNIGDTIGGITAPFINAIGAILIYVAFKEQIKANDLIKEQQYFQHIQEQIHRLEDDFLDIPSIIKGINENLIYSKTLGNNYNANVQYKYEINGELLNKAIYITVIFHQTSNLIDKMQSNKKFMHNKLKTLYKIMYQDNFIEIRSLLNKVLHMESESTAYSAELLSQIQSLQNLFLSDEKVLKSS